MGFCKSAGLPVFSKMLAVPVGFTRHLTKVPFSHQSIGGGRLPTAEAAGEILSLCLEQQSPNR